MAVTLMSYFFGREANQNADDNQQVVPKEPVISVTEQERVRRINKLNEALMSFPPSTPEERAYAAIRHDVDPRLFVPSQVAEDLIRSERERKIEWENWRRLALFTQSVASVAIFTVAILGETEVLPIPKETNIFILLGGVAAVGNTIYHCIRG